MSVVSNSSCERFVSVSVERGSAAHSLGVVERVCVVFAIVVVAQVVVYTDFRLLGETN